MMRAYSRSIGVNKMRVCPVTLAAAAVLIAAQSAQATVSLINASAFDGAQQVVTFDSIANEAPITNEFAGQGVVFSGALYGMTNPGDTHMFAGPPAAIASNWLYSHGSLGGTSFTAAFSSDENLLGFYQELNPGDNLTVNLFENGNPVDSINLPSPASTQGTFVGLEDTSAFNSAEFTVTTNVNGFVALDFFQFESVAPVPEPASAALIATGLLGFAGLRKRRNT